MLGRPLIVSAGLAGNIQRPHFEALLREYRPKRGTATPEVERPSTRSWSWNLPDQRSDIIAKRSQREVVVLENRRSRSIIDRARRPLATSGFVETRMECGDVDAHRSLPARHESDQLSSATA